VLHAVGPLLLRHVGERRVDGLGHRREDEGGGAEDDDALAGVEADVESHWDFSLIG